MYHNDPANYGKGLEAFSKALPSLVEAMKALNYEQMQEIGLGEADQRCGLSPSCPFPSSLPVTSSTPTPEQ